MPLAGPVEGSSEDRAGAAASPRTPSHWTVELARSRRVALRVVGLSLVLAAVLELLLLCAEAAVGGLGAFGSATAFAADLVEKVPWSVFVCTGVWLGLQLGRGRPPLSLVGLVAAPVGSLLLRATAEGAHAFAFAAAPVGPSP